MSEQPTLAILNPTCLDVLDAHRAHLDALPIAWTADETFRSITVERLEAVLASADGLILPASLRTAPSAEQMRRHTGLKVLSIAASGYDWLDVDAATRNGIVVTYAPAREGVEVVADMAFGLMLAAARQIPAHDRQVRGGDFSRGVGTMLWGKTLGIVGLGRIGKAVARRARGFDMTVIAADPQADAVFAAEHAIERVDLDDLLRRSDFVSLHVRLDASTAGMIGRRELALMKPPAYLINTARDGLVDQQALADALNSGQLAGAGLDDPPSAGFDAIASDRVVYTPHLGNRAREGMEAVFRLAIDNAAAVLSGERPEHVVNPRVYERPIRAAACRERQHR